MKFETFKYLWNQGIVPAVDNAIREIHASDIEKYSVKKNVSPKDLNKVYEEYNTIRDEVKEKYFNAADTTHRIDIHKICACITGALLRKKLIEFSLKDADIPVEIILSNYVVAFLAANHILYMFMLSDLEKEGKWDIYKALKGQKTFFFPETHKGHDSYVQGRIKTLALNDGYGNDFDVLSYADMLFWIETYNIDLIQKACDQKK